MSSMKAIKRFLDPTWHPGKAAMAGIWATVAYSIAMESDKLLIGNKFSDVRFIEGLVEGEKRTRQGFILSWALHVLNGIALAELYGAIVKRYLPGPHWLKGSIFGEVFIAAAWWLTPLADKYHPLIKNGEMPPLANWRSFRQNLLRHLAFGLTLGLLYKHN